MTKVVEYMGIPVIVDDEEELLQPEDQAALITILEKSEIQNFTMTPNADGTFTYSFNYRIPRMDAVKLQNLGDT